MKIDAGTHVGPYRVVRLLGAGEMGEVYFARDPRLDRDVALKVLPDRIAANPDMVSRFEREVRAIAALSHPNVLSIYDVGQADGLTYAVMEYVPGVTLRARMARGPLSHTVVADLALQIARGLQAAHAKQIVHRDLKPENVLVSDDGHVKVLDFGLAKIAALADASAQQVTQFATMPGLVLGTLAYMAPEQMRGEAVDHRADIFSFGAMLFEMLAGRPPFLRTTPADTIAALMSAEGADPAAFSSMPPLLGRISARCLVKPVAERLDSLSEVIATLAGRADMDTSRHSSVTLTAATAAPAVRSIAVLPFADLTPARDQDYFCEGMAEEISTALSRVAGLRVVARTSAFRFKNRTDDVRDIGRALGVDTILEGSVRIAGRRMRVTTQLVNTADGYQHWSERFDRDTEDVFAVQDQIAETVRVVLSNELAAPLRTRVVSASPSIAGTPHAAPAPPLDVYTAYLRGRHQWGRRTEAGLDESVACFREALAASPHYAPAWAALADSYVTLAIYGLRSPAEVMPLARDAANAALAESPMLAGAHAALACVLALHDWTWDDADASFGRALAIDPNLATAHQWRAMHLLLPRGRMAEAAAALALARELDPVSPAIGASLGLQALFAGDLDGSLAHLDRALDLEPDAALLQFFRGMTLTERGDLVGALASFERAERIGGTRPELTAARGQAHARAGDRDRAVACLEQLDALAATRFVSPATVAQVHAALKDDARALDALERAADVRATDLVWINVRPVFKALREIPRFQALVAKIGVGTS